MLNVLDLRSTQITDAGCAALAAALDSGALPALKALFLDDTPASDAAVAAVVEARDTVLHRDLSEESASEWSESELPESDEDEQSFGTAESLISLSLGTA